MEDDIARGLNDVDQDDESQDEPEEPEPEPEPRNKKVKITDEKPRTKTKTKSESKKENQGMFIPLRTLSTQNLTLSAPDYHRDGVRRSKRQHYKPLDYWRGEKVVYGRPDFSGQEILVPHIREIIRIPKEQSEPLGKRKRGRSRSRTAGPPSVAGSKIVAFNPEEGWDDDTPSNAKVLDYRNGQEVERRKCPHPPCFVPWMTYGGRL
jgi:centromere protein C